jgi:hypothetical protein
VRLLLATVLTVTGCTWVSDAQYDDRVEELEEGLEEFLPAADEVVFMTAAGNKFYYVYTQRPLLALVLVSYDVTTDKRVDIDLVPEGSENHFNDAEDFEPQFRFSDKLVVECDFGTIRMWDAITGLKIQEHASGSDVPGTGTSKCSLDNDRITTIDVTDSNDEVYQWVPAQTSTPVLKMNLTERMTEGVAGDTGDIGGFASLGDTLVVLEGTRMWHVDLVSQQATWLGNDNLPASGLVVFDDRGTLYDTSEGVKYEQFDDLVIRSFDDMIGDGGYRMNSKRGDIHQLAEDGNYFLYKRYVIYRGNSGIFAYNLDTRKVTDLLLDRSDESRIYRGATMTDSGVLFVQHRDGFSSAQNEPVYKIDLNTRLP